MADRWNPPIIHWRSILIPIYVSLFSYGRRGGRVLWGNALYLFGVRLAVWNVERPEEARNKETTT